MTPDEFYRLRDDRTNRVTDDYNYHKLRIRVIADIQTVCTYNGQMQLLLVANMLARWCRQIEFGFPDALLDPLLQKGEHKTLHNRIKAEVYDADPFGNFAFKLYPSSGIEYTLQVGMGKDNFDRERVDFTINSNGWWSYAGQGRDINSSRFDTTYQNPAGAAFAACLGVADAFKVAVNLPSHYRVKSTAFSLFDFSVIRQAPKESNPGLPQRISLGNAHLIGVGSVGSAFAYLLGTLPVAGNLFIIDLDHVEYANLNRSPLFGSSSVTQPKVAIVADYLRDLLPVNTFLGRYDEFIQIHGREKVDLIFPLANEYGVRSVIEHNFPPLQIYGTTTSDWGVNYHRHIPFQDDCSLCRFPEDINEVAMICSKGKIEVEREKQVDAALPFSSVAAATLVLADLLKIQYQDYPFITTNFAFIDFKGNLELVNTHNKVSQKLCYCSTRSLRIHDREISSSKFFHSSKSGGKT